MFDLKRVHLVLFFTENMSLLSWEKGGVFDREVALYLALLPYLGGITFITYGKKTDLQFLDRLNGIEVVCNHRNLSPLWYRRLLTYWPSKWKKGDVVFKSNQVRGSDLALTVAKRYGKPFISRCGYLFADNMSWREGPNARVTRTSKQLENDVFNGADSVVVTTPAMKSMIMTDYNLNSSKIRVIPNYVDTDLFSPSTTNKTDRILIFIGRLEKTEKY